MHGESNRYREVAEHDEWKRKYKEALEKFKESHQIAFELLDIGGVHPEKVSSIENPYLDGEIDNEDFRNVGEHNVAVGICADNIADVLVKKGVLTEEGKSEIVLRALIHDANKRFEVMRKKAKRTGKDVDVYGEKGYETMFDYLKQNFPDLSPTLGVYLKNAGMETGHTSLKDFVTVNQSGEPYLKYHVQLPEMIVHLADDMTSSLDGKTNWVTAAERMKASDFENRYPFLYKEGFGFDSDGNVIFVEDINDSDKDLVTVKSYAEWQKLVAKLICNEITWMLELEGNSEEIIKQIANK